MNLSVNDLHLRDYCSTNLINIVEHGRTIRGLPKFPDLDLDEVEKGEISAEATSSWYLRSWRWKKFANQKIMSRIETTRGLSVVPQLIISRDALAKTDSHVLAAADHIYKLGRSTGYEWSATIYRAIDSNGQFLELHMLPHSSFSNRMIEREFSTQPLRDAGLREVKSLEIIRIHNHPKDFLWLESPWLSSADDLAVHSVYSFLNETATVREYVVPERLRGKYFLRRSVFPKP